MKYICKIIWWLIGWKIIGDVPREQKKYIIIVAPHTSNWDFVIGVLARGIMGFKSKYLGKKSLFRPPFGWIFRGLGGHPVDRSKNTNLVDQVVGIYERHERFVITLAPEGTRKGVTKWKTGFYYIAHRAKVPIVRSKIDRKKRAVEFYAPFWPSGNMEVDLPLIQEVYSK